MPFELADSSGSRELRGRLSYPRRLRGPGGLEPQHRPCVRKHIILPPNGQQLQPTRACPPGFPVLGPE
eukprot:3492222-Rhodomonas_salina.2